MWEARRRREEAEEEADRKLLDAVCKASLVEYNGRERALETFASETSQQTRAHETSSVALQRAKGEAEQRKHAAMQVVIDSKARAKHMSEKARDATSLYEQKATERLVKQAELDALKLREAQAAEMRAMQERTQAAVLKRAEAEQKAREARDKAEAMRCRAFQAASTLRANSRRQIETRLSHEEAQRQQEMQRKLDEIERAKAAAHERREAAAKKAADARRRADELRLRAEQARAGLMKHATAAAPPSRA
ncbi:unnamed protein product [Hyaloperonospora brassicae]|uniref:Trichohyalin-plectin-homology domain-containing protein n=1 Tax=Hyaloperonospora brassicae TaxID=162125 RepID=A0AAV0V1V5_HYABA|nr:unnamed protein product [Hyaloperonospora brassicae]